MTDTVPDRVDNFGSNGASLKAEEPVIEPELAVEVEEPTNTKTSSTKTKPGKTKAESKQEDDWVEDAEGNFVKRGE